MEDEGRRRRRMHRSRRIGLSAFPKHDKLITSMSLPTGHSEAFTLGAVGVCRSSAVCAPARVWRGFVPCQETPLQTNILVCGLRLLTTVPIVPIKIVSES